ncbi:ATP-binding Cassette (ABC) Superfamily [Pseudoloma neurophilia]|uniref:ATP-binding Cassette (ABC) Superfamily n=1 Tax=Pseudoloma neurophilia TaxID=146866 RepID=A0A0R0LUF9_9MICR|nr:ATP-binding Cassette (ABC) Superfamily [Pseudoloma neurophilia]
MIRRKSLTTFDVLKTVFYDYIKKIPLLKYSILPIMIIMIIARLMEIKVTEIIQKASQQMVKEIDFYSQTEESNHSPEYLHQHDSTRQSTYLQYLFISIFSSFLVEFQGFIFTSSVQSAYRTAIRNSILEYLKLGYHSFKNLGIGEISSNINRQSLAISEILDVFVLNLLPVLFIFVLSVIKVYFSLGFVPSMVIATAILLYTLVTIKMAIFRNEIRKRLNLSNNESKDKLIDILKNYDLVLSFNRESYEIDKYNEKLRDNERWSVYLWQTFYLLNFLQKFIFCIKTGIIIYLGIKYNMKYDQFVLFLSISRVLGVNLDKLGYMYSRFTTAILNAQMGHIIIENKKQLFPIDYFSTNITFKNVSILKNSSNSDDCCTNSDCKSSDSCNCDSKEQSSNIFSSSSENDQFFYESTQDKNYIFRNLNLEIKKGEKTVIIGKNGIGKSNFLKLLIKFNDYKGSIKIDNDELSTLKDEDVRRIVSYTLQDSLLMAGTVQENILYGVSDDKNEKYSELNFCENLFFSEQSDDQSQKSIFKNRKSEKQNEMIHLAQSLGYHESFLALPSGYSTFIGKNNSILSGGEKQKISIIRSLLKDSEIFIFDESTSNLDKKSEELFFNYITSDKMREKTVLCILHNLEMLEKFDRILYLTKNGIREVTRDEAMHLMANSEVIKNLSE